MSRHGPTGADGTQDAASPRRKAVSWTVDVLALAVSVVAMREASVLAGAVPAGIVVAVMVRKAVAGTLPPPAERGSRREAVDETLARMAVAGGFLAAGGLVTYALLPMLPWLVAVLSTKHGL